VRFDLTADGDVSDYNVTQMHAITDTLSTRLNCLRPTCVTTVRISAGSVLLSITLTIPNNGPVSSSATAEAVNASANALIASNPSEILSSLGVTVNATSAVTVLTQVPVPLAVAPPPPPSPPPLSPPGLGLAPEKDDFLSDPLNLGLISGGVALVLIAVCVFVWRGPLLNRRRRAGGGGSKIDPSDKGAPKSALRPAPMPAPNSAPNSSQRPPSSVAAAPSVFAEAYRQKLIARPLEAIAEETAEAKATAVSPVVLHSQIASNIAAAKQAKQAVPDAVPGAATTPARAAVQAEGTRDVLKVVSTGAVVSVGKEASPPPRGKEASPPPRPAPPSTGSAPPRASPKEAAADGGDGGVAPNPNPNPNHNPDGGDGGVAPGKHRRRRHRQTPERLEREDDERFLERMERRDEAEAEAVAGAASFIGGSKPAHVIANGPLPRLTEDQVVKALDEYTVKLGAKALFERLDANRSGRVDAHELSEALQRMKVGVLEEAETLELIKAINRRNGSQRDSLALDVFAVAFSSKVANAKQAPLPSQASPQQASPTPLPANVIELVLEAIQRQVDQLGTRAVFDAMDADRSGRVSADELVGALAKLKMAPLAMDAATAEELIRRINTRHGSKRKSLTFDIFAVAFAKGTVQGEGSRQTQQQQQQQLSPLPPSADKLKQQPPSPSPVTAEQAMIAMQGIVARMGVKATFDMIDANRSGNVSAGELARTLRKLHVVIEEASAQELIFSINARHGSKRKSLTFDIFAVAFAKGTVHGEGSRQTQQQQQQQLSPLPPSADKLKQQPPSPSPVTAEQAMIAMQGIVARMGVKATFDMIDANRSGNVSAGELARTLRKLHVVIEEASAQELIFSINARHGSKRKSLTFDIFAVAFGANSPVRV